MSLFFISGWVLGLVQARLPGAAKHLFPTFHVVFVQPLWAIACTDICAHVKNTKHWQPYYCWTPENTAHTLWKYSTHLVNPQRWNVAAQVAGKLKMVTCNLSQPKWGYHLHKKEEYIRRSPYFMSSVRTCIIWKRWCRNGHVLRKDANFITKAAIHWTPQRKQKCGWLKTTWQGTGSGNEEDELQLGHHPGAGQWQTGVEDLRCCPIRQLAWWVAVSYTHLTLPTRRTV